MQDTTTSTCLQDLILPFQALADVHWHHPMTLAENPAARRVTANCQLGSLRAQPAFGHIPLLQALHHHIKAGTAMVKPVSKCPTWAYALLIS